MLTIKRAYEAYDPNDGYRILVDRLWPRGVSKEKAHLDYWAKDITPTTLIRKEFNHEAANFDSFKVKYLRELANNPDVPAFIELVHEQLQKGNVTLIYGARDPKINHAIILEGFINQELKTLKDSSK